jgi:hypothetical protein
MGLLDNIDEDKIADNIMKGLGFEEDTTPDVVAPRTTNTPTTQQTNSQVKETVETQDVDLDEVEIRLAKAQLYRQFISGNIFDGGGAAVEEVEKEFQTFARQRLQVLIGIATVKKPITLPFDEDEIKVLKVLINGIKSRILKNPTLVEPKNTKPPKLKPVITQTEPFVEKQVVAVPNKKPQLKIRQVPDEVPRQTKKPVIKKDVTGVKSVTQVLNRTQVPVDGSVVEENGEKFTIKYVGMPDIDEFGRMDGEMVRRLGNKQTTVLSNNIQVFKDGENVFKVLKTKITPVQNILGRTPFPTREQTESISTQTATRQAQALGNISISKILGNN